MTLQNIYSTLTCGLQIFAGSPIYHLPGNVISATVGLVYINVQPKYVIMCPTNGNQPNFTKLWQQLPQPSPH